MLNLPVKLPVIKNREEGSRDRNHGIQVLWNAVTSEAHCFRCDCLCCYLIHMLFSTAVYVFIQFLSRLAVPRTTCILARNPSLYFSWRSLKIHANDQILS
jgi:hypothetical protein